MARFVQVGTVYYNLDQAVEVRLGGGDFLYVILANGAQVNIPPGPVADGIRAQLPPYVEPPPAPPGSVKVSGGD